MSCPNPTDCGEHERCGPRAEDAKAERVVLAFLLEHPSLLTIPELSLALNADPGFDTDDAVERAVRELVGAGLLHCERAFVVPTRAALYLARLEMD
jgi:hypothetical protein